MSEYNTVNPGLAGVTVPVIGTIGVGVGTGLDGCVGYAVGMVVAVGVGFGFVFP